MARNYLDGTPHHVETWRDRVRRPLHRHRFVVDHTDDDSCHCGAVRNYITGVVFYLD